MEFFVFVFFCFRMISNSLPRFSSFDSWIRLLLLMLFFSIYLLF